MPSSIWCSSVHPPLVVGTLESGRIGCPPFGCSGCCSPSWPHSPWLHFGGGSTIACARKLPDMKQGAGSAKTVVLARGTGRRVKPARAGVLRQFLERRSTAANPPSRAGQRGARIDRVNGLTLVVAWRKLVTYDLGLWSHHHRHTDRGGDCPRPRRVVPQQSAFRDRTPWGKYKPHAVGRIFIFSCRSWSGSPTSTASREIAIDIAEQICITRRQCAGGRPMRCCTCR